jgi:phosphoglycolate phosphatase
MTQDLADLLRGTELLILDFDGPVAGLFAGYPAADIAAELRTLAASDGYHLTARDPLALLQEAEPFGDAELSARLAAAHRDAEVQAAQTAEPTPGVVEVLEATRGAHRRVALASNNAVEALRAYLRRHHLLDAVDLVVGRYDGMSPHLLKPHPHLVHRVLDGLDIAPENAVFVGDSVSDVEAGKAAGVATVGYANKLGKDDRLRNAGANVVIHHMAELADAMRAVATPAR